MSNVSERTLAKLRAINHFLHEVYGKDTLLSDVLKQAGLSDEQIETIKKNHLTACIDSITEFLIDASALNNEKHIRQHDIVMRYLGLPDGKEATLQEIAEGYDLSRERIRQIRDQRLRVLRHPTQRKKLAEAIVQIAIQYL